MKKNIVCLVFLLILSSFVTQYLAIAQEEGKLNLNTATLEQLTKEAGVKPELAKKIIDKRKANGEFVDMDELLDVDGVDNNLLRQLKQKMFVKPAAGCNC